MDIPIPEFSRQQIPRFPHEKEIRSIDPALFRPIPPSLQSIMPLLKAIYQRTEPPEPEMVAAPVPKPIPESPDLVAMEKRIIAAIAGRKPEIKSPFLKRKEVIELLKSRSVLERCERSEWLKATTRQPRLVLYRRTEVMACVYRISQGEYP
jgi:hypothetical protein